MHSYDTLTSGAAPDYTPTHVTTDPFLRGYAFEPVTILSIVTIADQVWTSSRGGIEGSSSYQWPSINASLETLERWRYHPPQLQRLPRCFWGRLHQDVSSPSECKCAAWCRWQGTGGREERAQEQQANGSRWMDSSDYSKRCVCYYRKGNLRLE